MSGGYTPLYETLLTGTLYGKWPHVGVWACLLSRVSREGVIDERPEMLAAMMGIDVAVLLSCIHDFMQPDPGSRTSTNEGRRLALLDPNRDWGWKVINASKYREKARKKSFDENRTESGDDADRKRASRDVPRCPAMSRDVPLSESESESYAESEEDKSKSPERCSPAVTADPPRKKSSSPKKRPKTSLPDEFGLDQDLSAYAIKNLPGVDPPELLESFKAKAVAKGWEYCDWRKAMQEFIRNCAPNSGHWASGQYPKQKTNSGSFSRNAPA